MKAKRYAIIGVAATLLASCVKDELHNTPHPDRGAVTVSLTGWTAGDDYVLDIDGKTADITGSPFVYPDPLLPGAHSLVVYNRAEGFTFDGRTARVNTRDDKARADGATIIPLPGYLKTSSQEITVVADDTLRVTPSPRQQVRELTLMVEPTGDAADRIEAIEGRLSGAAGTLDFATGIHGAPSEVELHFMKITSGDDAGKWTATVRLLGIAGDAQRLTATLTYTNGNPQPTGLESDLTAALADFNSDKTTPLSLGGTMAETPDEVDSTATITDWEEVDGGNVNAEL